MSLRARIAAGQVALFTGAGISTASGIPDFRGPDGFWKRYAPIPFSDFVRDPKARVESWRRKFAVDARIQAAKPNDGHKALARMVALGLAEAVITQNVDNLHQESGLTEEQVIELHGNGTWASCLDCGLRHALEEVRAQFVANAEAKPPTCLSCGGAVKSATISFGQAMPEAAMRRAEALASRCETFLVVGSSLSVFPAASLPLLARRAGAVLAIVNREPTEFDAIAEHIVREDASVFLRQLMDSLRPV